MTTPVPIGPSGPTVRRLVVGSQLRRLREAAGITREAAGYAIRGSESKISRLELGRVSFKTARHHRPAQAVRDPRGRRARRGAGDARARRPTSPAGGTGTTTSSPSGSRPTSAWRRPPSHIRTYENQFVPGLLQTEDYARAVVSIGMQRAPARGHRAAGSRLRMERQRILDRPDPPADLGGDRRSRPAAPDERAPSDAGADPAPARPHEAAQHHGAGGPVPPGRPRRARAARSRSCASPEEDLPDVVYLEQLVSALYLDKRDQVDRYAQVMVRLAGESPTPEATRSC